MSEKKSKAFVIRHARTKMFVAMTELLNGKIKAYWAYDILDAQVWDDSKVASKACAQYFPMTKEADFQRIELTKDILQLAVAEAEAA